MQWNDIIFSTNEHFASWMNFFWWKLHSDHGWSLRNTLHRIVEKLIGLGLIQRAPWDESHFHLQRYLSISRWMTESLVVVHLLLIFFFFFWKWTIYENMLHDESSELLNICSGNKKKNHLNASMFPPQLLPVCLVILTEYLKHFDLCA